MVESALKTKTPSLIGLSVRNYELDGHDLSPENSASELATAAFSKTQNKIPSTKNIESNKQQEDSYYYTKVTDLAKEGCLMDEYDSDSINLNPIQDDIKISEAKRLKMLQKQKMLNHKNPAEFTLSPTHSNSLVSSTDPIDNDFITPSASSSNIIDSYPIKKIKNSLGEDIKNQPSIPHLARGDSYQKTQDVDERSSRPIIQRNNTSEYLKELNRSMSKDRESVQRRSSDESGFHSETEGLSHSEKNGPYYSIPKEDVEAAIGSYTYAPAKRIASIIDEEEENDVLMED
ncbi:hypothetical protein ACO0SA_002781 [Hanseniaspora valbyensis]